MNDNNFNENDLSPEGRYILYRLAKSEGNLKLWIVGGLALGKILSTGEIPSLSQAAGVGMVCGLLKLLTVLR